MVVNRAVLFTIFLSLFNLVCADELEITWLVDDGPPFFITKGAQQGQGICDITQSYLIAELSGVKHKSIVVPGKRITHMLATGEKVCSVCMIRRQKDNPKTTYSLPNIVYPPHSLITSSTKRAKLIQRHGDPISLDSLMTDTSLVFARHSGRTFGKALRPVMQKREAGSNMITIHNEEDSTTAVLRLLSVGRADYSIEYQPVVKYYNSDKEQDLVTIPIKENRDTFIYGAVGCSTSAPDDYALRAIAKVDNAFRKIVSSAKYRKDIKQWFDNQNQVYDTWFEGMYQTYYRGK